jgi:hypothetical protein
VEKYRFSFKIFLPFSSFNPDDGMGFLTDGKWKVKAKKLQFPVQKDEENFHRVLFEFSEKFFDEKIFLETF